jgi:hypothetical protein
MSEACDVCGVGTLVEKHGTYVYEWPSSVSRKPTEFSDADWLECDSCDEQVLPARLLERIEAARYRVEGLLTPTEMRAIRGSRSQVEMARFIGAGDKTYARWEAGLSIQTKAMDTLIRVAAMCPAVLEDIESVRGQEASGKRMPYAAGPIVGYCRIPLDGTFSQVLKTGSTWSSSSLGTYARAELEALVMKWSIVRKSHGSKKEKNGRSELRLVA